MANYSNNWIRTNKIDQREQALKVLKKAKELEKLKIKQKQNYDS
jgi:hypothetical protein